MKKQAEPRYKSQKRQQYRGERRSRVHKEWKYRRADHGEEMERLTRAPKCANIEAMRRFRAKPYQLQYQEERRQYKNE